MKINIPDAVRSAINDADLVQFRRKTAGFRTDPRKQQRLAALAALRTGRLDPLRACAAFVYEWCHAYTETYEAARIRELLGKKARHPIYRAPFLNGMPTTDADVTAMLLLEWPAAAATGLPILWYKEYRNTSHGPSTIEKLRIAGADALVENLHPDYLDGCKHHLESPNCWKYILQELARFYPYT